MHNAKIQSVRALQSRVRSRRAAQAFVIEGVRLCEEALQAGWEAQQVFFTPELNPRGQAVVDGFAAQGAATESVSEGVMQAISDTQTPQGLLVVLSMPSPAPPALADFVFIPDGVRDPGNLGTMLRTAAAAGTDAVLLPPGVVDVYSPKVLRAAMGAHFYLPVLSLDWQEIGAFCRQAGLTTYLAAAGSGTLYTQCDFRSPLAILVGGEATGAGPQGQELAAIQVHIPMPGGAESLNAAVAAGILLFEVVRQRSAP